MNRLREECDYIIGLGMGIDSSVSSDSADEYDILIFLVLAAAILHTMDQDEDVVLVGLCYGTDGCLALTNTKHYKDPMFYSCVLPAIKQGDDRKATMPYHVCLNL